MKKITLLIFLLPLLAKAQPIINLEDFDYQKFQWAKYFVINKND